MATLISKQQATQPASCTSNRYEVTSNDLPVHCPTPEMALWNGHPKVYIPLKAIGDEYCCPYCSATFVMVDK